jgi:excinuclease UvrABC helicase subunit UvrB
MDFVQKGDVKNANLLKTIVLQSLVDEGYLSVDKAKEFNTRYAVIMAEPSWFTSIYETLFPSRKNGIYYHVIRFVGNDTDSKVNNSNPIDEDESLSELKFQLSKAESDENYNLAKKLRDKIQKIENSKK